MSIEFGRTEDGTSGRGRSSRSEEILRTKAGSFSWGVGTGAGIRGSEPAFTSAPSLCDACEGTQVLETVVCTEGGYATLTSPTGPSSSTETEIDNLSAKVTMEVGLVPRCTNVGIVIRSRMLDDGFEFLELLHIEVSIEFMLMVNVWTLTQKRFPSRTARRSLCERPTASPKIHRQDDSVCGPPLQIQRTRRKQGHT